MALDHQAVKVKNLLFIHMMFDWKIFKKSGFLSFSDFVSWKCAEPCGVYSSSPGCDAAWSKLRGLLLTACLKAFSPFLPSLCLSVFAPPGQPAAAAWKDLPAACATATLASARATAERLGSTAMAAGQATGASPTAGPASATDTPPSVTRGLGAASAAGPTLGGSSVKGGEPGQLSQMETLQESRHAASAEPWLCL